MHLNVALREPLVPDGDETWREPLDPADGPAIAPGRQDDALVNLTTGGRTVVVAGDQALPDARSLAEAGGWPLLAEPSSGHRAGPNALATYRLLLDHLGADIERVVVAGRPTLSRQVTRLLARTDLEVVRLGDDPRTPKVTGDSERGWLNRWLDADALADDAVAQVLVDEPLNGLAVARVVAASVPDGGLLVAGSSSAVRDLDLADPWDADTAAACSRTAAPPASTARSPPRSAPPSRTADRRTR